MSRRGLQSQTTAKLILIDVRSVPLRDDSFNGKEQTLLLYIEGHSYSAVALKCASVPKARLLMIRCAARGFEQMRFRYAVGYPTIMSVEILDVYVRHGYQFAIIREYIAPDVPNRSRLLGQECYLIFHLQSTVYQDFLIGIRKKMDF